MSAWASIYDYAIWAVTAASELTLLLLALRFGSSFGSGAKHRPVVFLLTVHLLSDPVMLELGRRASARAYVYGFIVVLLADYCAQFFMVWSLFCAVKRHDLTCGLGFSGWVAIWATMAFSVYVGTKHEPLRSAYSFLTHGDAVLSYARCCFLAEIISFSWFIQSPWSTGELNRLAGLCLHAIAQLVFVQSQIYYGFVGHAVARIIPGVVYLVTLGLLASSVLPERAASQVSIAEIDEMKRALSVSASIVTRRSVANVRNSAGKENPAK